MLSGGVDSFRDASQDVRSLDGTCCSTSSARSAEKVRSPRVLVFHRNEEQKYSDTGNRTPGYRVRGDNVSHYTISDTASSFMSEIWICKAIQHESHNPPLSHNDRKGGFENLALGTY